MFETLEQQRAAAGNLEKARADESHSWPVFEHPGVLSAEQLRCLNEKAQELGRPLTDAERDFLLGAKVPQPRVSAVRFI